MRELLVDIAPRCLVDDAELLDRMADMRGIRVQTVNLHHLALARREHSFAQVIRKADFVTADGWPIAAAISALGKEVDRVTGSEFLVKMLADERFAQKRIGLLGASVDAGERLSDLFISNGLRLDFREHGDRRAWEFANIVVALEAQRIDILLIAVTPPHGDEIGNSLRVAGFSGSIIGIGGAVNMAAGLTNTAPDTFRKLKLEWAYRMAQEPGRLWKRYIVECLPVFIVDLLPILLTKRLGLSRRAT
jgi:N-acetylglucosaminyldiphosphoundecaprenol N-acetyl-beta-D-mannosaminyltransferase